MITLFATLSVILNILFIGAIVYYKALITEFLSLRKSKKLYEFQKELDEKLERKFKAEKVAELFSRFFNKRMGGDNIYEFEKLNWELCFYLPKDIICEISQKLVRCNRKIEAIELFIKIREYLGLNDGLKAENIAYIPEHANDYGRNSKDD